MNSKSWESNFLMNRRYKTLLYIYLDVNLV